MSVTEIAALLLLLLRFRLRELIIKASKLYNIEYSSLIFELGSRKLVAGQEDLIMEIAKNFKK
jgi:hypothetical protein